MPKVLLLVNNKFGFQIQLSVNPKFMATTHLVSFCNSMTHSLLLYLLHGLFCVIHFFLFFFFSSLFSSFCFSLNNTLSIISFLQSLYVHHKCRVILLVFLCFISFIIYKHLLLNQHLSLSSLIRWSPFFLCPQTNCKWFNMLVHNFLNNMWYITSGAADL